MAQTELAREQVPAQVPAPPAPVPMSVPTAVPTQQPQSSLFSKPGSVRCVFVYFSENDIFILALVTNFKLTHTASTSVTFCVCVWYIFPSYPIFLSLCPVNSEHMSSLPLAVSDPSFPSPSLGLPSATPSPSMGLPSAAAPPSSTGPPAASRVESSGPRSLPPHLGYSQSKDVPSAAALTVRINPFLKNPNDEGVF